MTADGVGRLLVFLALFGLAGWSFVGAAWLAWAMPWPAEPEPSAWLPVISQLVGVIMLGMATVVLGSMAVSALRAPLEPPPESDLTEPP